MNYELMHFGVPGMKWGHRKAKGSGPSNRTIRRMNREKNKAVKRIGKDIKINKKSLDYLNQGKVDITRETPTNKAGKQYVERRRKAIYNTIKSYTNLQKRVSDIDVTKMNNHKEVRDYIKRMESKNYRKHVATQDWS